LISLIPNLGRIVPIIGIVLAFAVGWTINGWRLNANIASLKASYAEGIATYQLEARNREKALVEAANNIRRQKDEQISRINSELWVTLDGLHSRPSRSSMSSDTATCSGATGAELSREDAEFLARESARADKAVASLNMCISQYNSLK
jgi:hypothetical protein